MKIQHTATVKITSTLKWEDFKHQAEVGGIPDFAKPSVAKINSGSGGFSDYEYGIKFDWETGA